VKHNIAASIAAVCLMLMGSTRASAIFIQTVDDSAATFSSFNSDLQVGADPNAVGGTYHYISNWGDSDNASGIVRYQLHDVPAGNHLYHISFSSPTSAIFGVSGNIAQWHVFDVAADGTENFVQNIPWAGQFGTNKQWIGTNSGYTPGGITQLGPGPQNDASQDDGAAIWLNGSGGSDPYIYIKYQPFYFEPIAFDAITVTQVAPPATGDLNFDGIVNIVDLTIVADTWQSTDLSGDANFDGRVDIGDITLIAENWLLVVNNSNGISAVPEPSTGLMAVFAAIGGAGLWSRRRHGVK